MSRKQHLSRLAAPKTWPIKRKGIKWVAKPKPGSHSLKTSMPISVILREVLRVSDSLRETKFLINNKEILVNNNAVRETNFSVGLFDVITFKSTKKNYRVLISRNGKFILNEIPEKEAEIILLRIDNKTKISKGKIQLNFMNGWNLLVDKDEYKTTEVLVYDLKTKKIKEVLKNEKGNIVYFFSGKHNGKVAKLDSIIEKGTLRKQKIAEVINEEGEKWQTTINNMIVVGKKQAVLTLNNG